MKHCKTKDILICVAISLISCLVSALIAIFLTQKPNLLGIGQAAYIPRTITAQNLYHNGVWQSASKRMTFTGTLTGGNVTFYMTVGGLVGGAAICTATPTNVHILVNDVNNTFGWGYTVTNSNKNLNITVNQRAFTTIVPPLLGISLLNSTSLSPAPNGTPVMATAECI